MDGIISVLVAERQPLLREGLVRAIRQRANLQLVSEAPDGRAALERILQHQPDVAVVDASLRRLDGAQVLNAVVRDGLSTRVLFVAAADDQDGAYRAIAAGAAGVLSKHTDAAQLCSAVMTAAGGDAVIAPETQTWVVRAIRRRAQPQEAILTDRERRVLLLIAEGRSAAEIGRALHLSAGTVKTILVKLYDRLGVSERAAAVAAAMRRGLIE